jgi:hypothetical protein
MSRSGKIRSTIGPAIKYLRERMKIAIILLDDIPNKIEDTLTKLRHEQFRLNRTLSHLDNAHNEWQMLINILHGDALNAENNIYDNLKMDDVHFAEYIEECKQILVDIEIKRAEYLEHSHEGNTHYSNFADNNNNANATATKMDNQQNNIIYEPQEILRQNQTVKKAHENSLNREDSLSIKLPPFQIQKLKEDPLNFFAFWHTLGMSADITRIPPVRILDNIMSMVSGYDVRNDNGKLVVIENKVLPHAPEAKVTTFADFDSLNQIPLIMMDRKICEKSLDVYVYVPLNKLATNIEIPLYQLNMEELVVYGQNWSWNHKTIHKLEMSNSKLEWIIYIGKFGQFFQSVEENSPFIFKIYTSVGPNIYGQPVELIFQENCNLAALKAIVNSMTPSIDEEINLDLENLDELGVIAIKVPKINKICENLIALNKFNSLGKISGTIYRGNNQEKLAEILPIKLNQISLHIHVVKMKAMIVEQNKNKIWSKLWICQARRMGNNNMRKYLISVISPLFARHLMPRLPPDRGKNSTSFRLEGHIYLLAIINGNDLNSNRMSENKMKKASKWNIQILMSVFELITYWIKFSGCLLKNLPFFIPVIIGLILILDYFIGNNSICHIYHLINVNELKDLLLSFSADGCQSVATLKLFGEEQITKFSQSLYYRDIK